MATGISVPNKFSVWRKADTGPRRGQQSPADAATCPDAFQAWSSACADLRHAEHVGDVDKVLAFAVAVMRTHNALSRERLAEGWEPPQSALTDLERDEFLVNIHADPNNPDF
jgi:hypothetical protein